MGNFYLDTEEGIEKAAKYHKEKDYDNCEDEILILKDYIDVRVERAKKIYSIYVDGSRIEDENSIECSSAVGIHTKDTTWIHNSYKELAVFTSTDLEWKAIQRGLEFYLEQIKEGLKPHDFVIYTDSQPAAAQYAKESKIRVDSIKVIYNRVLELRDEIARYSAAKLKDIVYIPRESNIFVHSAAIALNR